MNGIAWRQSQGGERRVIGAANGGRDTTRQTTRAVTPGHAVLPSPFEYRCPLHWQDRKSVV